MIWTETRNGLSTIVSLEARRCPHALTGVYVGEAGHHGSWMSPSVYGAKGKDGRIDIAEASWLSWLRKSDAHGVRSLPRVSRQLARVRPSYSSTRTEHGASSVWLVFKMI